MVKNLMDKGSSVIKVIGGVKKGIQVSNKLLLIYKSAAVLPVL